MAPVTETPAKASWLAVLLSYAGRCRGKMAVSLLCSVASVAAGLVPFYAVYRIIDEVIAPAPDGGAVLAWVGAAAAGYVASKVLFGASTLLSHVSAYTILESLRDDVVEKLMKTSLGTAASKSIGQIKNVFVDRIEGVEVPLAHMIPELSGNVLLRLPSRCGWHSSTGASRLRAWSPCPSGWSCSQAAWGRTTGCTPPTWPRATM